MKIDEETLAFALEAIGIAQQNRQKELDQMSYREYLQTEEWKQKREAARKRAGARCQRCQSPINETRLDTHHKQYTRRGHEHLDDLMILCARCHRKEHQIK